MYHTYILYSEKLNKYYIGATEDIDRRLQEHNSGRSPYTKVGAPRYADWLTAKRKACIATGP